MIFCLSGDFIFWVKSPLTNALLVQAYEQTHDAQTAAKCFREGTARRLSGTVCSIRLFQVSGGSRQAGNQPETAPVVTEIFALRVQGVGDTGIALLLNRRGG